MLIISIHYNIIINVSKIHNLAFRVPMKLIRFNELKSPSLWGIFGIIHIFRKICISSTAKPKSTMSNLFVGCCVGSGWPATPGFQHQFCCPQHWTSSCKNWQTRALTAAGAPSACLFLSCFLKARGKTRKDYKKAEYHTLTDCCTVVKFIFHWAPKKGPIYQSKSV